MFGQTKGEMSFRQEYIDIICLMILLVIFFIALFLTHGVWLIVGAILLALTGAVLGRTVGKMVTVK